MHKKRDIKFGERLKFLRKKAGFTQVDIANSISISPGSYQRYEYGSFPSRKNLNKIVELFKCSKIWLIHSRGNPYPMDGEFQKYSFVSGKTGVEKNEQNKPPPIYKVEDQGDQVAAPEREYDPHGGWQPRPEMLDDDHRMLGFAFQILISKSIYRNALIANITAFYNAFLADQELKKTQKDLKDTKNILKDQVVEIDNLKKKCDELIERIVALEKKGDIEKDVEKS